MEKRDIITSIVLLMFLAIIVIDFITGKIVPWFQQGANPPKVK